MSTFFANADRYFQGETWVVSAGRRTLDSLTTNLLDPQGVDKLAVRAAIPALNALLGRLATPQDSAWAYIRLAEAHLLLDEVQPACATLRFARGVDRTANQRHHQQVHRATPLRRIESSLMSGGKIWN